MSGGKSSPSSALLPPAMAAASLFIPPPSSFPFRCFHLERNVFTSLYISLPYSSTCIWGGEGQGEIYGIGYKKGGERGEMGASSDLNYAHWVKDARFTSACVFSALSSRNVPSMILFSAFCHLSMVENSFWNGSSCPPAFNHSRKPWWKKSFAAFQQQT